MEDLGKDNSHKIFAEDMISTENPRIVSTS